MELEMCPKDTDAPTWKKYKHKLLTSVADGDGRTRVTLYALSIILWIAGA